MKERGKSPDEKAEKMKKAAIVGKGLAAIGFGAITVNKSAEWKENETHNKKRSKSLKSKSVLNIEAPDQKTHLKAENFKDAKIMPLIEEAWELLNKIKKW